MSTYAIGDIQGCYDTLVKLLEVIRFRPENDTLWLCGDLVNRGPKSAAVLRWAMGQDQRVQSVLGNHDLHLLAAAAGHGRTNGGDTLGDVLNAPDATELIDWLKHRPLFLRGNGYVMVHAGLHPDWELDLAAELAKEGEKAIVDGSWLAAWELARREPPPWSPELSGAARIAAILSVFTAIRTVDQTGCLLRDFTGPPWSRPQGARPWYQGRDDEQRVVFGHWAAQGLHIDDGVVGLDSGCVWKNRLTAMCLDDCRVFSQRAVE